MLVLENHVNNKQYLLKLFVQNHVIEKVFFSSFSWLFCHGALKLDPIYIFATLFLWTSLLFIASINHQTCDLPRHQSEIRRWSTRRGEGSYEERDLEDALLYQSEIRRTDLRFLCIGTLDGCGLVACYHSIVPFVLQRNYFMGTKFCGLMMMDMFVDTWICRFQLC